MCCITCQMRFNGCSGRAGAQRTLELASLLSAQRIGRGRRESRVLRQLPTSTLNQSRVGSFVRRSGAINCFGTSHCFSPRNALKLGCDCHVRRCRGFRSISSSRSGSLGGGLGLGGALGLGGGLGLSRSSMLRWPRRRCRNRASINIRNIVVKLIVVANSARVVFFFAVFMSSLVSSLVNVVVLAVIVVNALFVRLVWFGTLFILV